MSALPKISIVMAVYNSAQFLRQSLSSIRWQTFADWECICVDDGSTDGSAEILHDFATADSRFRVFSQPNRGVVAALNRGDLLARAPWIARMDSDDIALPDRLAKQWSYVHQHKGIVALGGRVQLIDVDGMPLGIGRFATKHDQLECELCNGTGAGFAHPTLLMSREAIVAVGQYREQFRWAHDSDLLLRLARFGKLANLSDIVLLYRQHQESFCATHRDQIRNDLRKVLAEARSDRQLSTPAAIDGKLKLRRLRSSVASKWARQAARSGYYRTALKNWRIQVQNEPLSLLTARTTIEMLLRIAQSSVRGREAPPPVLPPWQQYDCRRSAA